MTPPPAIPGPAGPLPCTVLPARPSHTLLLATNNVHKLDELRQILARLPVVLVSPRQLALDVEVAETGGTFEENAVLKASAFARAAGLPALADDSGLEVDALSGEPGVHSRRFAGEHASDADRIAAVLERLKDVPDERRAARFRCVMAVATPQALIGTVEGRCEGWIAGQPRGGHGFGYDPIFWLPDRSRTMAELAPGEKHAVSHRGRAGAAVCALLGRWLRGDV